MTGSIIQWVNTSNSLSGLIQNIGLGLLTVLIPVAIVIFDKDKKDFSDLDETLILDHIIKAKNLLFYFALIFLPLVFWDKAQGVVRFAILFVAAVGMYQLAQTLIKSYRWLKGSRFELRFSYLKQLNDPSDMEKVWRSVWQTVDINTANERDFFKLFSSKIDGMLADGNDLPTAAKLLNDFQIFLRNRSIIFLVVLNEFFPVFLEWHFSVWYKEYENLIEADKNIDRWSHYNEVSRVLDTIFREIEKRALEQRHAYSFLHSLDKHVRQYELVSIDGKENRKYFYLENLLAIFYSDFFEAVEKSSESYDIWGHYFPSDWKVTLGHLNNKDNLAAQITLQQFAEWLQPRLGRDKKEFDSELDTIARELFPEVDPPVWAQLLIFALTPHDPTQRAKYIVETPWNFGFVGRIRMFSRVAGEESEDAMRDRMSQSMREREAAELRSTFELALRLFPRVYSKDMVIKYISDLKALQYEEGSDYEAQRVRLLGNFESLRVYLEQQTEIVKNNA